MRAKLKQISIYDWPVYDLSGYPDYVGKVSRHLDDGDQRLLALKFDPSIESLQLWNFLLTEEDRLYAAREAGIKIVGTMKDLGTIPVLAYSFPNSIAFYPDGAWWIPCIMEINQDCLKVADQLGIDQSYCPVRAMLGAFGEHFPVPDLLISSVGACCDDFSAIAQRLNSLGYDIHWWEMPHRRLAQANEASVKLPDGSLVPLTLVEHITQELSDIVAKLEQLNGSQLTDEMLQQGIRKANQVRTLLQSLRTKVFTSPKVVLPALELLIAEMLAIHYCSDQNETIKILTKLNNLVDRRIANDQSFFDEDRVPVFWINPVADLRAMNLLEEVGGRICGTDYLFFHALDLIPEDLEPIEALAQTAFMDRMVGTSQARAERICQEIEKYGSKAVVISRVPGASHCAIEGKIIGEMIKDKIGIPVVEIETPSLVDACSSSIKTRLEALIETAQQR